MLNLIKVDNYPPERVQELWDYLNEEEYAFDDISRGNHEVLLRSLFMPDTECYEVLGGNSDLCGLVMATGILPRVQATLHFAHWGNLPVTTIRALALGLMEDLFSRHDLMRLNAYIPQYNKKVIRLASLLGFKLEGTLRKAFLYKGEYLDLYAYGMLREEYNDFKELANASRSGSRPTHSGRDGSARRRVSVSG